MGIGSAGSDRVPSRHSRFVESNTIRIRKFHVLRVLFLTLIYMGKKAYIASLTNDIVPPFNESYHDCLGFFFANIINKVDQSDL